MACPICCMRSDSLRTFAARSSGLGARFFLAISRQVYAYSFKLGNPQQQGSGLPLVLTPRLRERGNSVSPA